MSIELIKSPIYPYPGIPDPGFQVAAIPLISQVYWKVQRDDMNGTGYTVQDNGGFLQINFGVVEGSASIGGGLFITQKLTDPIGTIPVYAGRHIITGTVVLGEKYVTSTPYNGNDNAGYLTSQHKDVVSLDAEIDIKAAGIEPFTQSYKIPYNKPVFGLDLGETMRPTFATIESQYFEATITLSGTFSGGVETGGALKPYDLQLFESKVVQGYEYGSNLTGLVLRNQLPGKILTAFKEPKIYNDYPTFFSFYIDEVFDPQQRIVRRQYLDVNKADIGVPVDQLFFDTGMGIYHKDLNLPSKPVNAFYVEYWLATQSGTPLTEQSTYKIENLCRGEVMLIWINRLGGLDSYAFNIWNEASLESHQGLKYEVGGTFDLQDNVNRETVEMGDYNQIYTLTVKGLDRFDLEAMTEILRSSSVEVMTFDVVHEQYNRLEVSIIDGFSTTYNYGQLTQYDFTCRIKLPLESRLLSKLVTYPI